MGASNSTDQFDIFAQLNQDTTLQSLPVTPEEKDCTPTRRVKGYENGLLKYLREDEDGGAKTIWGAFQRGLKRAPKSNMFGTRKHEADGKRGAYVWETYEEVNQKVHSIAGGLTALGLKAGANVGILSQNRAEWAEFALALYGSSMRCVPLYATLGDGAVEYIVAHAEIEVIATNKEEFKKLVKSLDKLDHLKTVILFDYDEKYGNKAETVTEEEEKAAPAGKSIMGLSKLMRMSPPGFAPANPTEEDMAFIMYTSGTTGQPKGVLLTHGNVMASCGNVPIIFQLNEKDVHLSYLPLAHILETVVQVVMYAAGGGIGYFQGDIKMLNDDMKTLQPSVLPGVPRVFSRIYEKVFSQVNSAMCVKRSVFKKQYAAQLARIRAGRPRSAWADRKIFNPVKKAAGLERVRVILTGAAPCPPRVIEFLRVLTGAAVLQGYGMTETAGTISVTVPSDRNLDHVGPPLPSIEIKLRDVEEMNYLHTNTPATGEILVRGASIFKGYYKNDAATKECLTDDGWLCTGDVGRWNPNGTLTIIDRKKNIFKLAQGEYVASEKIELEYGTNPAIAQLWLYGNGFKSFLLAVIVPSIEATLKFSMTQQWLPPTTDFSLSADNIKKYRALWGTYGAQLKAEWMRILNAGSGKLKGFEKIKDILIETDVDGFGQAFRVDNDCLTPSFKLRRLVLLKRYHEQLKLLFAENGEPPSPDEKWGVEN